MKRALLIFAASLPLVASGAPQWQERLANAIYRAEGGPRARVPYGVLRFSGHSESECRAVCIRTIDHAWRDYISTHSDRELSHFIPFLADRYCPPSADPAGNRNWKHNVQSIYAH